jgi:hypothetical protein
MPDFVVRIKKLLVGCSMNFCDEISDLDWAVALPQLIELLENTLKESNKKFQKVNQKSTTTMVR